MISAQFPQIGEAIGTHHVGSLEEDDPDLQPPISHIMEAEHAPAPCGCPKRTQPPPTPPELPYPATEANRERLQEFLLDYYGSSTFNTCPHQRLPLMEAPPMRLMVDHSAQPVAHHKAIPVPLHWCDDVKAGLDSDVQHGVLEPVPIGEPVTWCHRMVVCAKKDGSPRRTVDLQALNLHATRETHHTQSPFHQARSVPPNKKKTVFDAWNGYHSVPLHPDDRHLTTFITPWGRYRYCVAPQGYVASGDAYTRCYDELVADITNKTKCVDDALLWADTIEESFWRAVQWLDICGRNGIILNPPPKFTFAADTVEFAGFELSLTDVRPCRKFLQAILDFPTPVNITDIRSWFGLVNQVSYAFSMTKRMEPFRQFLKPNIQFCWDTELESLFSESCATVSGWCISRVPDTKLLMQCPAIPLAHLAHQSWNCQMMCLLSSTSITCPLLDLWHTPFSLVSGLLMITSPTAWSTTSRNLIQQLWTVFRQWPGIECGWSQPVIQTWTSLCPLSNLACPVIVMNSLPHSETTTNSAMICTLLMELSSTRSV